MNSYANVVEEAGDVAGVLHVGSIRCGRYSPLFVAQR